MIQLHHPVVDPVIGEGEMAVDLDLESALCRIVAHRRSGVFFAAVDFHSGFPLSCNPSSGSPTANHLLPQGEQGEQGEKGIPSPHAGEGGAQRRVRGYGPTIELIPSPDLLAQIDLSLWER